MVDPQEQANKWVKNMEKEGGLKVVTLKQSDYLRTLENAITFGQPVLMQARAIGTLAIAKLRHLHLRPLRATFAAFAAFATFAQCCSRSTYISRMYTSPPCTHLLMQEVMEELDPSLEPIMSKAVIKVGNRSIMKLGDKEVEYNPDFRFYLTTKLNNPHYTPEISTKATIVNFCVKQQGLEEQLLGTVVRKERPELEMQKNDLVVAVAAGKRKLVELEDTILRMLSSATGSLLDDEELVLTLQVSTNPWC